MKIRTLISLGGVIVLTLAGLVVVKVNSVLIDRHGSRMTQTASNARGIYMLMFPAEMDAFTAGAPSVYPTTNWSSSTDYFNAASNTIFADVAPSFFSAPGIPYSAAWPLTTSNNAWCLNASFTNSEEAHPDTPLLFTRNLRFRTNDAGTVHPYLVDIPPFGKKGCVVVGFGGLTRKLLKQDLHLAVPSTPPEHLSLILTP
ncbi:MAG: hypothetical protein O3B24_04550 [Verrucomicrobia bacterium]|nr:hypothetical protein [Verrucomicrobiota bacterium]